MAKGSGSNSVYNSNAEILLLPAEFIKRRGLRKPP